MGGVGVQDDHLGHEPPAHEAVDPQVGGELRGRPLLARVDAVEDMIPREILRDPHQEEALLRIAMEIPEA